jgi:hypothetical protein
LYQFIARVRSVAADWLADAAHELMRWRLRRYCGHVIERTPSYTHKTLHAALAGSISCAHSGHDPATIIDGEVIGLRG